MIIDSENKIFQLAANFVNYTDKHIFVTGKAGTGKTTFLKYIREQCTKKMAVVAPTGVAAINAGGVTMHSFFQLPFGLFLPTTEYGGNEARQSFANFHTLFSNLRLSMAKRELFRELELLIIDEVSMVRADMLDAADAILRHVRGNSTQPFGGVQVLYIGDLYQLPPVVSNNEWETMRQCYPSPFFFDSLALKASPLLYLELQTIYRQNDIEFINILNNVRNNRITHADLQRLHQNYNPTFYPTKEENYITLTSHVAKADQINNMEFEKLDAKQHTFSADVSGEFGEKSFPADKILRIKVGAQIMFIKNDKGEVRRYYNGKIGIVQGITSENKIVILFPKENNTIEIEKETWKNIRYKYNDEHNKLEEEELGEFTQYPIRLAWAITIHKSQGLTFEKAVIDAGASFAAGQVYVSLSRLTSMEGLVLRSRIEAHAISTDHRVITFCNNAGCDDTSLQEILRGEQRNFLFKTLIKAFDWSKLKELYEKHCEQIVQQLIPEKDHAITLAQEGYKAIGKQKGIADNFIRHLYQLMDQATADNHVQLNERVSSGATYFTKEIKSQLLGPLVQHTLDIKSKKRVSKYTKGLNLLSRNLSRKIEDIERAVKIAEGMMNGMDVDDLLSILETPTTTPPITPEQIKSTAEKIPTKKITLDLYLEGKTPQEIATLRELTLNTIEGHLLSFIPTGETTAAQFVTEIKMQAIQKAITEMGEDISLSTIKAHLGDAYSYTEIKASMKAMEGLKV